MNGRVKEAQLLQTKMSAVQEEIDKVNKETGSSMETLVQMDLFKERIQVINWFNYLISSVDEEREEGPARG